MSLLAGDEYGGNNDHNLVWFPFIIIQVVNWNREKKIARRNKITPGNWEVGEIPTMRLKLLPAKKGGGGVERSKMSGCFKASPLGCVPVCIPSEEARPRFQVPREFCTGDEHGWVPKPLGLSF